MTKVFLGYGGGGADLLAGRAAPATRPLRILLSYHYYKNEDLDVLLGLFGDHSLDVFFDSGAYSAWSTGVAISVEEYAAWLLRWGRLATCFAALDCIGDPEGSFRQTEELRNMLSGSYLDGKLPIPVVHGLDSGGGFQYISRYLDAGYAYIGLAPGPIRRNRPVLAAWLDRCFSLGGRDAQFHGFAVTGWRELASYPWHSVDSSSWTSGFRFARLLLFDVKRGRFVQINMRDRKNLLQNTALLAAYGLRPTEVQASGYDRDMLCRICIESWQRAEEWLSNKHERESRLYLVTGDDTSSSNTGVKALSRGRAEQSRGVT